MIVLKSVRLGTLRFRHLYSIHLCLLVLTLVEKLFYSFLADRVGLKHGACCGASVRRARSEAERLGEACHGSDERGRVGGGSGGDDRFMGKRMAQVGYPGAGYSYRAPYGYQINNGRVGSGYQAAYGLSQRAYMRAAPLTVTNYQPLINAITSLPGWNEPAGHGRVTHVERPKPTVPYDDLLGPEGKVRWPSAAPEGPARKAAEDAVKSAVAEHDKYGQATIRRVVDARNKLTEYLRESLLTVKAHNRADGDGLERFVVELQKTLATLAVNY